MNSPENTETPDIIELKIDSLAYGGEGVARSEGKVYFVNGALPGEKVLFRGSV